jgi:hypothetical protein
VISRSFANVKGAGVGIQNEVTILKYTNMLMCALMLVETSAAAQTAPPTQFSFKGNYLGMPLQEFKTKNVGESVFINTGKPKWNGRANKKDTQEVPTPLCTDQYQGFPGDPQNEAPNEVLCNPSPGDRNQSALQFAGIQAVSMFYRFLGSRLYDIEIHLVSHDYGDVKAAFIQKYGAPTSTTSERYQNGYGATWTGEVCHWRSGNQAIALTEGSGNGPGQDSRSFASLALAVFLDTSNVPRSSTKSADF